MPIEPRKSAPRKSASRKSAKRAKSPPTSSEPTSSEPTEWVDYTSDLGIVDPRDILEAAINAGEYVYDLETNSLNPRRGRIEGVGIYVPERNGGQAIRAWFPFVDYTFLCYGPPDPDHPDGEPPLLDLRAALPQQETMEKLRPLFIHPKIIKIAQGGKFDTGFLYYSPGTDQPIVVADPIGDAMLADFLTDERRRRYGLKWRVRDEFNHNMTTYKEAVRGQTSLAFMNAKPLAVYGMDDCYWTWRHHERAIKRLRRQTPSRRKSPTWPVEKSMGFPMGKLEAIYWGIDVPISRIIMEMENAGVLIDFLHLRKVEERLEKEKKEIAHRIEEYLTWPLNPNSTSECADALFAEPPDGLGLPMAGIPVGKSGDVSTADKAIKHFARFHPLVADILKYRSHDTILSGFVKKLIKLSLESSTGRVHAKFNQTNTVIGRLCIASGMPVEVVRDVGKYPKGIPIEDLKPGDLAYTYDKNLKLVLRSVKNVWKTGHRQVYRIHWKGGNRYRRGYIDVTPEHPIRLIDGSYVQAGALKPGDCVMALSRGVAKDGYARIYATGHEPLDREHRFIYEQVHPDFDQENVVHHEDGNKLNNNVENLKDLPRSDHSSLHAKEMWRDQATRIRIVNAIIDRWKDPVYKSKHAARMRQWWQEGKFKKPSGRDHPQFKEIPREWMEDILWSAGGRVSVFANQFGINHDRAKRFLREYEIDWKTIRLLHRDDGSLITYEEVERARTLTQRKALKLIGKGYYKFRELQNFYGFDVPFNHTIVKIEPLPGLVDVYDLEIEGTHNFIASEICVHNSSSDPINFQNQPREKNLVRRAYCAYRPGTEDPDMDLYGADYGQIELRVAAHLSKDEGMIEVYQMGGICKSDDEHACERYKLWVCEECDHTWTPDNWSAPNHTLVCPACKTKEKTEHQARCRHVDLHQRTAEDARVKRNPLAKNCVTGESLILTEQGLLRMDEVVTAQGRTRKTIGIMSDDGKIRPTESTWGGGVQPVADVHMEYGLKVTATYDHKFYVMRAGKVEQVPVNEIKSGDPVLIMVGRDIHGEDVKLPQVKVEARASYKDVALPRFLTANVARFFGYFVAEGRQETDATRGYYQVQFGFSKTESAGMIEDFVPCMRSLIGDRFNEWSNEFSIYYTITSKKLNAWFDAIDMGYASGDKKIPSVIRRAPWSIKREFFRALFEGDGTCKSVGRGKKSYALVYTSKSEELIRQIQAEMMNVNILGYVGSEMRKTQKGQQRYWTWTVRRQLDLSRFAEMVGFISERKQGRLLEALQDGIADYSNRFLDDVEPLLEQVWDKVKRKQKDKLREVIRRKKNPVRFGDTRVALLSGVLPEEINNFVDAGVWTAKVQKIEDAGEAEVYDVYEPERTAMVVNSCVILDCNFGLLYRMGAPKFCVYADLFDADGLPMVEFAKDIIRRWHDAYPSIKPFHDITEAKVKKNKWIAQTIFGRRRRLDQEVRRNEFRAVTQAIQFQVSGSAQDIMKTAMVRCFKARNAKIANSRPAERRLWERTRFLLQIHDEIVLSGPRELRGPICSLIKEGMEGVGRGHLRVPLAVDVKHGQSWDHIH